MAGKGAGAWRLVESRTVARNEWLTIDECDFELPDGSRNEGFHVVRERPGVLVVALTEGREALVVRQYRAAVEAFELEFPAGFLEEGETDFLRRAQTELREETGYESDTWHSLGEIHLAPHRIDKRDQLFLALDVRKVSGQDLDPSEFVEVGLMPIQRVREAVETGEMTSAVCVAALWKALLLLERLDTPPHAPEDLPTAGETVAAENVCPDCDGSGKQAGKPCPTCRGTGRVKEWVGGGG